MSNNNNNYNLWCVYIIWKLGYTFLFTEKIRLVGKVASSTERTELHS